MQRQSSRQRRSECRKSGTFFMIENAVKQEFQRCFLYHFGGEAEKSCNKPWLPGLVEKMKGGYFSVLTRGSGEPRKFCVALSYLTYPPFLKLLEAAEQEFGFDQPGILVIPCEACELQKILSRKQA